MMKPELAQRCVVGAAQQIAGFLQLPQIPAAVLRRRTAEGIEHFRVQFRP